MTLAIRHRGRLRGGLLGLSPSGDSRDRERRSGGGSSGYSTSGAALGPKMKKRGLREKGVALVLTLIAITMLEIALTDMQQSTSTAHALSVSQRDSLQAEYLARSAINLTRLLSALRRPITQAIAPLYTMLIGHGPPDKLPIYSYANEILAPFCDFESTLAGETGVDFSASEGLGETGGTCEIFGIAENSRINVNDPLFHTGDQARLNVARHLYGLMGGLQSPSPFDPLFARRDADGLLTTRDDIVTSMIDWWDEDSQRTVFDVNTGSDGAISSSGTEDDPYSRFDDSYRIKNAPFDSLEELRLVRGVSDDFWATFVEPDPDDPSARALTIYGSGSVNLNETDPRVLLAHLCSFVPTATLCIDPGEAAKFIQVMLTARSLAPVPWFSDANQFLEFLQGQGRLYTMLQQATSFLGGGGAADGGAPADPSSNPLLFTPITIPGTVQQQMRATFVPTAEILSINATGRVGRTEVHIQTVMNFDEQWTPPPPNAGTMPQSGVFHYWRVE